MLRITGILTLLVSLLAVSSTVRREHQDYVPDEKTAVRIAEAVLVAQFGEDRMKAHLSLHADGSNRDYWIVEGSRPQGETPKFGGGPAVWINKHSGCIMNVIEHTK
jgi:hypothetical protein